MGGVYRSMWHDTEIMVHTPYKNNSPNSIECIHWSNDLASELFIYYIDMLGFDVAEILFDRTMENCSSTDGWTINADAAKVFGITNLNF